MVVTFGKFMDDVILVSLENEYSPIVTRPGAEKLVRLPLSEKEYFPMLVTLLGRETAVKLLQPPNA